MQLRQPSPDALVSFSDFLLDRFGLVATMQVALLASVAVHALVIVGVTISPPAIRWDAPYNVMDVVLVNARTLAKPQKADALAQASLDGGGNTDQKLRAKSPFPNVETKNEPSVELKAAESRVKQLEAEAKELMTRMKSSAAVAQIEPPRDMVKKADVEARDLIEKSLEIQRLEAQIAREHLAYQQRPRKKFIGARVEESRFAAYVDNVRRKIERVGTLNYPAEAKMRKIYGSLQLTVAIKADGEIESVEINRSSGQRVLDQAALRIVRLAAPFERFPDAIRVDTDILNITRTWMFTREDQILAE